MNIFLMYSKTSVRDRQKMQMLGAKVLTLLFWNSHILTLR